jgi:hypothetical protein
MLLPIFEELISIPENEVAKASMTKNAVGKVGVTIPRWMY